jgi:hypothetical protein
MESLKPKLKALFIGLLGIFIILIPFQNCSRVNFRANGNVSLANVLASTYDPNLPSCHNLEITGITSDQSCNCSSQDISEASSRTVVGKFLYNMQESDFCAAAKHIGLIRNSEMVTINIKVGLPCQYFYGELRNGITSKDLTALNPVATFYFRSNDNICSTSPITTNDVTCPSGTMTWTGSNGDNCSGNISAYTGTDNFITTAILDDDFSNNSAGGSAYFECKKNDATGTTGSWLPVTEIPAYSAFCSTTPPIPTCNRAFSGQTFADASQLHGRNLCSGGVTVNNLINITANGWTWTCQGQGVNANLSESCSATLLVTTATTCNAPAGSYCSPGTNLPITCSSNSSCAGGTASPQVCGTGLVPNADRTACVSNNITNTGNTINTGNTNNTNVSTCTAPAGSYCTSGATTPSTCPAGSYCTGGTAAPITCGFGLIPNSTKTACIATVATITISNPSPTVIGKGSVVFDIDYGPDTLSSSIALREGFIQLTGAGSTGCDVVTTTTGIELKRKVYVSNCKSDGPVYLNILGGTAKSTSNADAPFAGPSNSFTVDISGPVMGGGVLTLSTKSVLRYPYVVMTPASYGGIYDDINSIWYSPTITFQPAVDAAGNGVSRYIAKITHENGTFGDGFSVISGNPVRFINGGLPAAELGKRYTITVRAVDNLNNEGPESTVATWTNISECDAAVPGATCANGNIAIGSTDNSTRYMMTPGGCSEVPSATAGPRADVTNDDYPASDFNATCSGGNDTVRKFWNNGALDASGNMKSPYDIPSLTNQTNTVSQSTMWTDAIDDKSGSVSTPIIAGIVLTTAQGGGRHAAASYCDNLVTGGYSDWFLPNRREAIMFHDVLVHGETTPFKGLDNNWYWTSTEASATHAWAIALNYSRYGNDNTNVQQAQKNGWSINVRCVRKY